MNLKRFFQSKFKGASKRTQQKTAKAGSPLEVSANTNQMNNLTTVMGSNSPRNQTMTARSGQFVNGSLTVRGQEDNLAKEFAVIRGDAEANDMLNNTVDVIDFHYNSAKPPQRSTDNKNLNRMLGSEDGVITGRSLADLSSIR